MFDDINYWRSKAQNLENHIQEVSEAIRLDGGQKVWTLVSKVRELVQEREALKQKVEELSNVTAAEHDKKNLDVMG